MKLTTVCQACTLATQGRVCGLLLDGFFLEKTKLDASAAASVEKVVLQNPWGSSLSAQVLTCIRQRGQPLLCTVTGLGLTRYLFLSGVEMGECLEN